VTVAESDGENPAPDRARRRSGARKLIVTLIPLALIALIALIIGKLTILEPPPTPAVVAARSAQYQHDLETRCAVANGMKTPSAPQIADATGPTLDLDSKTMNLDGTHYLKVGVSLQLPPKTVVDDVKVSENWGSVVSQLVLDTFSGRSFRELSKDGVRETLQHQIGYQACVRTRGKVVTVYFVDFVMQ
jgi:flagellar basal body-associated protein FliL